MLSSFHEMMLSLCFNSCSNGKKKYPLPRRGLTCANKSVLCLDPHAAVHRNAIVTENMQLLLPTLQRTDVWSVSVNNLQCEQLKQAVSTRQALKYDMLLCL